MTCAVGQIGLLGFGRLGPPLGIGSGADTDGSNKLVSRSRRNTSSASSTTRAKRRPIELNFA
jgi:hypothetical protein